MMATAYRLKILAGSLATGVACYTGWKHFVSLVSIHTSVLKHKASLNPLRHNISYFINFRIIQVSFLPLKVSPELPKRC